VLRKTKPRQVYCRGLLIFRVLLTAFAKLELSSAGF